MSVINRPSQCRLHKGSPFLIHFLIAVSNLPRLGGFAEIHELRQGLVPNSLTIPFTLNWNLASNKKCNKEKRAWFNKGFNDNILV